VVAVKLRDRLRNIADIFSGRRAARVRGAVMLTAIGYRPDSTWVLKARELWRGIAPEKSDESYIQISP